MHVLVNFNKKNAKLTLFNMHNSRNKTNIFPHTNSAFDVPHILFMQTLSSDMFINIKIIFMLNTSHSLSIWGYSSCNCLYKCFLSVFKEVGVNLRWFEYRAGCLVAVSRQANLIFHDPAASIIISFATKKKTHLKIRAR